jgi:uncharacterized protein
MAIVDCDTHSRPSWESLTAFLSPRWRRQLEVGGTLRWANESMYYVRPRRLASRTDAYPPSGGLPGSDPEFMREQLLDLYDVKAAILNPIPQMSVGNQAPELADNLTRAVNECTRQDWLPADPRLLASICVAWEDGALAAEEIHRMAGTPGFVQVLGNIRNRDPLGNRRYWPIYEAAIEHDLPVAFHVAGGGGHAVTGAGFPSYYFEDHSGFEQAFPVQMTSMILEGVFERFPTLKVVFQEGGFSWVGPLAWRLDHSWALLKDEVPFLKRKPSEYIHDHFWYTTQPVEEPPRPEFFVQAYEQFGLQDRLLFSSDYPHWDFDSPDRFLPSIVPSDVREDILGRNAARLYRLELSEARRGAHAS